MERSMINKIWKTVIDNADTYVRLLKIDAYCDELGCISLDSSGDESFSSGWGISCNHVSTDLADIRLAIEPLICYLQNVLVDTLSKYVTLDIPKSAAADAPLEDMVNAHDLFSNIQSSACKMEEAIKKGQDISIPENNFNWLIEELNRVDIAEHSKRRMLNPRIKKDILDHSAESKGEK